VTGITVDRRVRPDKREAVLMLIDVVDRHLPSGVPMADVTLRRVLSAMNVRVTILALISNFGEYQVGVAVLATNALMHPTQSEAGRPMIELQNVAKGFPTLGSMAILARDF
jgi:hypothetical protein